MTNVGNLDEAYRAVLQERDLLAVDLAAVTAERDALKAQLAAVPVKAIRYYFNNSVAIDSAPLYDYAIAEHAVKAWLEVTK